MGERYRAIVFSEYGGPEVLRLAERHAPQPGPGQVRVVVRASGVNPIDWKIRSGAMAGSRPREFPIIPGVELAGVVDRLGQDVDDFAVGDQVLGTAAGTYAELALARVGSLAHKPARLPWEVAAALPVAATTAYRVLALLGASAGQTLLVDGAAGAVGTVTVQLARHRGLTVVGTASEHNHAYLRSLGVVPVTYGEGLEQRVRAAAPRGVDIALDASGRGSLPALVALTGDPARVVSIADHAAATALGVRFSSGGPDEVPGSLADAVALAEEGTISIPIARTYPLAEAAQAQRDSEAGHLRGKLILLTG